MNEDWSFTPYDAEADKALEYLWEFDSFSIYRKELQKVFDYIDKLENIIYGYTE